MISPGSVSEAEPSENEDEEEEMGLGVSDSIGFGASVDSRDFLPIPGDLVCLTVTLVYFSFSSLPPPPFLFLPFFPLPFLTLFVHPAFAVLTMTIIFPILDSDASSEEEIQETIQNPAEDVTSQIEMTSEPGTLD